MKKLILLFFLFCQAIVNAQVTFVKISENYFRSRPFGKPYSSFIAHLINDPTMVNKTITKKNDSTLFFVKADYSSHNPFFFSSIKTTIVLAEKEEKADSTGRTETIFLYQLLGYAKPGEEGLKEVQNEYEKFCKRYKKGFDDSRFKEITYGEKKTGEVRDYSLKYADFYPMTVAWASNRDNSENIFALTIRFRVTQNQAYLWVVNQ